MMVNYYEYLRSSEWNWMRLEKLAEVDCECERCGEGDDVLDVHHVTYARLGEEWFEDLEVLCRRCHEVEHGRGWR